MATFNEIFGSILLFLLVFGMSATVDIHTLLAQFQNRKAILLGVFLQFTILPACGFCVVKFLELDKSVGIMVLVVTSSPGGSYSNWWCSIFNADLALSITMTAISTLLSVLLMPLNLLLYCKHAYHASDDVIHSLDFHSLFVALTVVISAIGCGLFVSAKVHSYRFNIVANRCGSCAGLCLVGYSMLVSTTAGGAEEKEGGNNGDDNGGNGTQVWDHGWEFYVGVMLPCCAGLVVANILTSFLSLKKPERVTLSVECCYQNVGIATSVALTMFEGDELAQAMAVPLYYGLVEAIILGLYCIVAWKAGWTKAPKNVSFYTMITTSYEVLLVEHLDLKAVEVVLPKLSKYQQQDDVNEKANGAGDTIYVKYNVGDDDGEMEMREGDEFQKLNSCMGCIDLQSRPKEASGYQLPDVPESE